MRIQVEGLAREALVYVPPAAKGKHPPVVFVFHGHGGNSRNMVRTMAIQRHWPDAIAVYPQGLNTPGALTDPEGKRTGWQHAAGAQQNRDLKFFDAMLARLKQDYQPDEKRIYCTGHSNGGSFTYLLWAARGGVFAAVAPSGCAFRDAAKLPPKPCLHVAGATDPLVKFAWQQLTMAAVRKVNGCEEEGREWAENCSLYPSRTGTPFVAFIHPGGHGFPAEAPPLIVRFFQEHPAQVTEAVIEQRFLQNKPRWAWASS
jgi:polyhydroxybutyrate depolymerase